MRFIGRVKWFDADQQNGALCGIDGTGYLFEWADREGARPPAAGELVTFSDEGHGRFARDLEPVG